MATLCQTWIFNRSTSREVPEVPVSQPDINLTMNSRCLTTINPDDHVILTEMDRCRQEDKKLDLNPLGFDLGCRSIFIPIEPDNPCTNV